MYNALLIAYANLAGNRENELLEKWAHWRYSCNKQVGKDLNVLLWRYD